MQIKGSNAIAVLVMAASILGAQFLEGNDIRKGGAKAPAKVSQSAPKAVTTIHQSKMVGCEDRDVQPCWTYDEGSYRIVYSYEPYSAKAVKLCKQEDGSGSTLPCIWKDNNAGEKPGMQTRNYFWSKTF